MKLKAKIIVIGALVIGIAVMAFVLLMQPKDAQQHSIKGQIMSVNETTLQIRTSENKEYLFNIQGIQATGGAFMTGNQVNVDYKGELEEIKQVQSVEVVALQVEAIQVIAVDENKENEKTEHHKKTASDILEGMTLDEKIAQMFMVRCPDDHQLEFVKENQVGGYILFAQDFKGKNTSQVQESIASYQKASKIPMLIGTDEEGGTVNRVSKYLRKSEFQSPQDIYKKGGFQAIKKDCQDKAKFLLNLGVNLNFAPVCDVSTNKSDFMNARSFGKNATETAKYVTTVVRANRENGILSVMKHFPGYGNNADTHTQICHDTRSYETFEKSDLIPFEQGIKAGGNCLLFSHNIVESIDSKNPASLSSEMHKLAREQLGFHGVIMTDDLKMEGVRELGTDGEIAVRAVLAGNDMLLSSYPQTQIKAIQKAVSEGKISENQIDQSVLRILTWKMDMGVIASEE